MKQETFEQRQARLAENARKEQEPLRTGIMARRGEIEKLLGARLTCAAIDALVWLCWHYQRREVYHERTTKHPALKRLLEKEERTIETLQSLEEKIQVSLDEHGFPFEFDEHGVLVNYRSEQTADLTRMLYRNREFRERNGMARRSITRSHSLDSAKRRFDFWYGVSRKRGRPKGAPSAMNILFVISETFREISRKRLSDYAAAELVARTLDAAGILALPNPDDDIFTYQDAVKTIQSEIGKADPPKEIETLKITKA
ncbi:MAG: hypothetical protein NTX50_24240 [Candidatus Sumerlaeota bacterium]|nr:hypothetical protein [Candidatus Sumerlaeota bacterium]